MKTIIIKSNGDVSGLNNFVKKLEKYTDYQIKDAVICTRLLGQDNYHTVYGEVKDAVALNDFDLFIIGVTCDMDVTTIQGLNRAHTLTVELDDYDSAKNYVIML